MALLTKTTQLTRSLRLPASRISAGESAEDAKDRSAALARVATKLGELRENLAKIQSNQRVPPDVAGAVTAAARGVEEDLKLLDAKLEGLRAVLSSGGRRSRTCARECRGGLTVPHTSAP